MGESVIEPRRRRRLLGAFLAKKGERFTFEIAVTRPLNSEPDSVLRILDAKGETLAENDDASREDPDYPESAAT